MFITLPRRMRTTNTTSNRSIITKMTTTRMEMRGKLRPFMSNPAMAGTPNTSRAYPRGPLAPMVETGLITRQVSTIQDILMTIITVISTLRPVPTEVQQLSLPILQEVEEDQTMRIPIKVPDTARRLAPVTIRPPTAIIQSIISVEAPTGIPIVIEASRDSHSCFLDINYNTYSEQALSPLNAHQCEFFFL